MSHHVTPSRGNQEARLLRATVVSNHKVCREHRRLVLEVELPPEARPGQFLHLGPLSADPAPAGHPFLRRAFSIGGLRSGPGGQQADILYRVWGGGTQWMAELRCGQAVSALGPLGNGFQLTERKPFAWLVAGGVGLPPLLWWAEYLRRAGRDAIAFCGARSGDLLPLDITDAGALDRDGRRPAYAAGEFATSGTPVIISTDDGSLGFRGTVRDALDAFHSAWGGDDDEVVVYCCGPERMMEAIAMWSLGRGMLCQLCMEREMACGTGTCQSCVVPVRDANVEDGWRYALCCSEGPVFEAQHVLWG